MSDIYVTGHQNPDTDSIVAAISYANLRQALGDRKYKAVRIGSVNDVTKKLLDRFDTDAPPLIHTMKTQVQDLAYDQPPTLTRSITIDRAWETMREAALHSVPTVHDDGTLFGILSTGDVADYNSPIYPWT